MIGTIFSKRNPDVGSRPGTLVISSDSPPPEIHVKHFNQNKLVEEHITDPEKLAKAFTDDTTTWVDVQGFGDEKLIKRIGKVFGLHPLAIEDVINVPQRPKAVPYDEQLLIIVKMVRLDDATIIDMEQVSIVLGKNYVLTFQERRGDVLDPVRQRIRAGNRRIRTMGPDYVAYAIFDTIIDGYYPVLEAIGEYLDQVEQTVVQDPHPELLMELNQIKNRLTNLRRAIWPQREVSNRLSRDDQPLIDPQVQVYLRDTYDHCVQTTEVVEMYRDIVTGLMNTYLSAVANRTNEVMKVLTIVATIFIPLTFVAGIYGMNFEHMPELHNQWGYPLTWATMVAVASLMLAFFWRRGWIGPPPNRQSQGPIDAQRRSG